ncbi:thiamine-phosphate diphosphorylase [PVC group bacterium (ex Bugula neritina AB1)]|nr:thiamine-phosphate diphosphorylase [PVC group bacterium (ex Bugula neritina AB1)]
MGGGERPIKGSLKKRFNEIDLYPVTCEELSCGRSDQWIVEQFLKGGAKVVQYRNKNLSDKEYLIMARRLRNLTLRYEALLIINDRVDIALEVDADGVHLGQDDLGCEKARLLLGSEKIIGVSCHSLEDAVNAQKDKATYVNVGPIFMTQTKKTSVTPVGIDLFQKVSSTIDLPVTVMGGIHADNIEMLLSVGAKKIAMVSELVQEKNVSERVHDLIEYIRSF